MNTAARMESNGSPNRIHCSQTTADLLRELGKGHWIEARADKVMAKGKGLMQTYWVAPTKRSRSTTTTDELHEDTTVDVDAGLELHSSGADKQDDMETLEQKLRERLSS